MPQTSESTRASAEPSSQDIRREEAPTLKEDTCKSTSRSVHNEVGGLEPTVSETGELMMKTLLASSITVPVST